MLKNKRKKYNITLNKKGEDYGFVFEKEKNIYSCLWHVPGYEKLKKNIENEYLFESYLNWKEYVRDKCSNYEKNKLIEFSHYLNQRLRNMKPAKDVKQLFFPIIMTLMLEEIIKFYLESTNLIEVFGTFKEGIIFMFIIIFIVLFVLCIFLYDFVFEFWKDNLEENLISDYKEIVDELIKQKEDEELTYKEI